MKKTVYSIIITAIIAFAFSGCVEEHYYRAHHQHSPHYYHRHHRTPPPGVDIRIHN